MNGSGATPATLTTNSVALNCNATKFIGSGSYNATQVAGFFAAGTNNRDAFTPTFTNLFVNGSNETGVSAFAATGLGAFFTSAAYIGAVKDSSDTWYAGWTCNSATASFGTGNSGACTSLPTT